MAVKYLCKELPDMPVQVFALYWFAEKVIKSRDWILFRGKGHRGLLKFLIKKKG